MAPIAVTRSIVAGSALADRVAEDYGLESPVSCKLISKMLRTQDNDHYLIRSGDQKFVLRLYQVGEHLGRRESDYLYELDWLDFLRQRQIRVAYPIARRNGGFLGQVEAPEGIRYYALFSFAPGKRMALDDEELLYTFGSRMGEIHLASNDYVPGYDRRPMDLEYLVDKPIEHIKRFWADRPDEKLNLLLESAQAAKDEIQGLIDNELHTEDGWGPIGGDFHPHNTHFDEHGEPTFFSFDLCGPGWRSYDIAVFLLNTRLLRLPSHLSAAFFAGYNAVRPLSDNEHEAISPFMTIRRIWLTGTFSLVDGVAGYTFLAPAHIDGQ